MNALFNKDMTVTEIARIANERWFKFHELDMYLNEEGKAAKETYNIIESDCDFAESLEELVREIDIDIEDTVIKSPLVIRNLKGFRKMITGDN